MATFAAEILADANSLAPVGASPADIPAEQMFAVVPAGLTYVMRGQDKNVNGQYDTWKSVGAADFAAANYHGALATPLRDVVVQSKG